MEFDNCSVELATSETERLAVSAPAATRSEPVRAWSESSAMLRAAPERESAWSPRVCTASPMADSSSAARACMASARALLRASAASSALTLARLSISPDPIADPHHGTGDLADLVAALLPVDMAELCIMRKALQCTGEAADRAHDGAPGQDRENQRGGEDRQGRDDDAPPGGDHIGQRLTFGLLGHERPLRTLPVEPAFLGETDKPGLIRIGEGAAAGGLDGGTRERGQHGRPFGQPAHRAQGAIGADHITLAGLPEPRSRRP